ncbi:carbamoyltransferase [Streptomyces sp. C]|nr:carbamoyltransferase [Streptomyces sp. C]
MRVLGVNGWPGASHDGAACLVVDGEVIALAEEERFTRNKHAYGEAPLNAAAYCLAEGGLTLDDIDVVAHGWDLPTLFADRGLDWFDSDADALEHLLPKALFPRARDPRLTFVDHHVAHAASAYLLSGRDRGAVLVLDGQGENASTTLAVGIDGRLKTLRSHTPGWSLGYFYAAVCAYAGLGADNAGKMMGLASYGTPLDLTFGGALGFTVATYHRRRRPARPALDRQHRRGDGHHPVLAGAPGEDPPGRPQPHRAPLRPARRPVHQDHRTGPVRVPGPRRHRAGRPGAGRDGPGARPAAGDRRDHADDRGRGRLQRHPQRQAHADARGPGPLRAADRG